MMNKRGSSILVILFALIYFMAGMVAYQFLKPVIDEQRGVSFMNCPAPSDDADRVTCLIIDAVIPLVIFGIACTAAGAVTKEVLFPK